MVLAGLGPVGPTELILILLIVVLLFGVGKLSSLGRDLGQGIREFRNATHDPQEEERKRREEERKRAEEAGRIAAGSAASPVATNGTATAIRPPDAIVMPSSSARPPDFTGQ